MSPLCPQPPLLYSPLPPLRPSSAQFGPKLPLSPLRPSVSSTALCPSTTTHPQWPSTALCPCYGPMPPLRPSITYTTLCPLYGFLYPLRPSTLYMALFPLYGPLSLCGTLSSLLDMGLSLFRKIMMLFRCFAKHVPPKPAISRKRETSKTTCFANTYRSAWALEYENELSGP
jgi:hypothetical protein